MHNTMRSNRRSMLITWFSVLTVLVSVFAYLPPASAQDDGTPDPPAPVETQLTLLQDAATVGTHRYRHHQLP